MHRTASLTTPRLFLTAVCAAVLGLSSVGCGGSSSGTPTTTDCDFAAANAIFTAKACSSCHDAAGTYAGFKMAPAGWEQNLVGVNPVGGQSQEVCMPSDGPYLVAGSNPATGLFIRKISGTGDLCTGGSRMPLGGSLTAEEAACVTSWATTLTSPSN